MNDSGKKHMAAATKTTTLDQPSLRILARDEAGTVLARNHVGRMAFSLHDRVDIEPIHYVYDTGWL
jgi:nitroimidazol reductase NimA-like FMN-containing flavoprotein (pyridoxamine 5'-phosphate oxidase superfamily)